MKLNLKILRQILIALMMVIFAQSYAQVGINTTTPHPSAALEVYSDTSGLLIPRIDRTSRIMMKNPADGLLVYDTNDSIYFYCINKKWYALNPVKSTFTLNGGTTDTVSYINGKVGIRVTNPTQALEVLGNFRLNGNMIGNVIATGTVTATKFYGEGTTPAGGIIMWSGAITAIPSGWALCDGRTVNIPTVGTYTTPNLKGRFIVGYDPADVDYDTINSTGPSYLDADGISNGSNTRDAKQIRLLDTQSGLASHGHSVIDQGHSHLYNIINKERTNVGNDGNWVLDDYQKDVPINTSTSYSNISIQNSIAQNALTPFENRPPYYVLAYIVKLPY